MSFNPIHPYTQEHEFTDAINGKIALFWEKKHQGLLSGKANTQLYWVKFTDSLHTKAIVLVNGRSESVLKYQELFYDLFNQGYDIYSYDHRGQGMSERITLDPHMGHVEEFDDYIDDLEDFLECFDFSIYDDTFLLAHSMGGTILTRYLQRHASLPYSAACLSAPMFGIQIPFYLKPIAKSLSKLLAQKLSKVDYALGQTGFESLPFEGNTLTNSQVRFNWSKQLALDVEKIQLGGPTHKWVWQGVDASQKCVKHASKTSLPTLIMQAGDDDLVDNKAQQRFMKTAKPIHQLTIIPDAKHELFLEKDSKREQAINSALEWFEQHQKERNK